MVRAVLHWLTPPLLVAGLALGVVGFSRAVFDPRVEARNADLRAEWTRVKAHNDALASEASALRDEIRRLREDPEESLHHARTGLGMVRRGEVVYRFVPAEGDVRP